MKEYTKPAVIDAFHSLTGRVVPFAVGLAMDFQEVSAVGLLVPESVL